MLNIFYARERVDKEKFIFDSLANKEKDRRAFLIVPDQFTLDAERALFDCLKKPALTDIEVLSMSRLGYRLLEEMGGAKRSFIDKYGRNILLSQVFAEQKENLQVFRGMESRGSFIELVNNFISELKQYDCGREEIRAAADRLEEDSFSRKKLEDLYLIYSEYEEKIKGKYTDSEDYIDLYLSKIQDSGLVKDSIVWVYGFDSLAPKALRILGELMCAASDVNVVLTYDSNRGARDSELFLLGEMVIKNLEREADSRGISHSKQQIDDIYKAAKAPAIEAIEKQLYALPAQSSDEIRGLTLVSCANPYNEAETAAAFVLKLVRDEGYRYRDIRIICNDQELRGPMLVRIFREYGMQLFSDEKKDLMSAPAAQYLIKLLSTVDNNMRTEDLIDMIKTGFSDLEPDEIRDLENYAIKYRIRFSMWKKPFKQGETEYGAEELQRLERLRMTAVEPLTRFEDCLNAETNGEFINRLYKYLYDDVKLPDKLQKHITLQNERGYVANAEQTAQIWEKLIGILDQIQEISADEKFVLSDFRNILESGLSQVEMGVLPPAMDGLVMGTSQRTRTGKIKALVVVGVNEGIFPKEAAAPGLFQGDEKELFAEQGVELCKADSIMLLEEKLGIYRNLSRPAEQLYVSYSAADTDGKATAKSAIFTRLEEIFPGLAVQKDVLNRSEATELINGETAGLRHAAEAINDGAQEGRLSENWQQVLDWYKLNRPGEIASLGNSLCFTNEVEDLGRDVANALFKKDMNKVMTLSPSRAERYSRCPFSHLITYGLKADERRMFEIAPREIGDLYHACLMQFADMLTEKGRELTDPESRWMTVERAESDKLVESIVKKQIAGYKEGLFGLGNNENYRTERLTGICAKVCWALVEQIRQGTVAAAEFEKRFGAGREIPPVTVKLENEEVYIEGIIDRIDYLKDDRVKIIDYKTGNESFDVGEAKAGYRLQLMLYLKAAAGNKKRPAGVFYFHVHEPMIERASNGDDEKVTNDIKKQFKLNGVVLNDPAVIQSIAGDFSGFSDVIPVRKTKDGFTGSGTLLSEDEFTELEAAVDEKLHEICRDMISGRVKISPMKTEDHSACEYCGYKGICRFDTIFEGCRWRIV